MKSCENCRYRKIDEDCLPCSACIDLGSDLSGWVGLTNADSIRGMTDEELGEFLGEVQWDVANYCGGVTQKQEFPVPEHRGAWLNWLKSPVDKEGEG